MESNIPQIIPDIAIPMIDSNPNDKNQSAPTTILPSVDNARPESMHDTPIASPVIAGDVVGTSIDTQQRKILGSFNFGGNGGLQNQNNAPLIDKTGLVSETNFPTASTVQVGPFTTSSLTPVDVPGSALNQFTVDRLVNVLFLVTIHGGNDNYPVDGSSMQITGVDVFNGSPQQLFTYPVNESWYLTFISQNPTTKLITGWTLNSNFNFATIAIQGSLPAGNHILKLQYNINGTGIAEIDLFEVAYIVLGS